MWRGSSEVESPDAARVESTEESAAKSARRYVHGHEFNASAPHTPSASGGGPPQGVVPQDLGRVWYKVGLNILLAIVTLGIWTWFWTYHTANDLKKYNGDGLGGTISLVLAIIINVVVWFTIPNEVEKMYEAMTGRARSVPCGGSGSSCRLSGPSSGT